MTYVEYITEVCAREDLIKRLRRRRQWIVNHPFSTGLSSADILKEAADYIESMEEA